MSKWGCLPVCVHKDEHDAVLKKVNSIKTKRMCGIFDKDIRNFGEGKNATKYDNNDPKGQRVTEKLANVLYVLAT